MSSSSSMAVDRPAKIDVGAFLAKTLSTAPAELHSYFESFQTLHERRLWHQLTNKLFEFCRVDVSRPYRVNVFEQFVRDFETKMNPLRLVELGVIVAKEFDNPSAHLNFLSSLLSRLTKEQSSEAQVLLLSTLAHAKLLYGDMEGTEKDMEEAWKVLDNLSGVDPSVNASYYRVAADFYKAKPDYGSYYKNSLLYLACIDVAVDLSPEERLMRAHDLGISALLGDTIYNFGELLMHPILDSLDGTPHELIKKLLFVFNEGNIGKFETLQTLLQREPILHSNFPFLRQKICLMALIESVFKRNASDRVLTFQTIAEETKLPLTEVEHLIMKALSLKLILGSIDQVAGNAHITWVQPRVLSREQIGLLANRLQAWCEKLHKVELRVAPELLNSSQHT